MERPERSVIPGGDSKSTDGPAALYAVVNKKKNVPPPVSKEENDGDISQIEGEITEGNVEPNDAPAAVYACSG